MSSETPQQTETGNYWKDWNNADGSFIRPPSSFKKTIEKGGQHEPERGQLHRSPLGF